MSAERFEQAWTHLWWRWGFTSPHTSRSYVPGERGYSWAEIQDMIALAEAAR